MTAHFVFHLAAPLLCPGLTPPAASPVLSSPHILVSRVRWAGSMDMDATQRPGHLGAAQPLQKGTAICLDPSDTKQPEAPIWGDRGAPLSLPPYQLKARAWGRSSSTSETRSHNTDHHRETGACTLCLCSCVFPHYCPPGSVHPHSCPGGSEALNGSGLRVSQETCCRLCEAGTYHSWALDTLPCQPCPAGFSCHQGENGKPGGQGLGLGSELG